MKKKTSHDFGPQLKARREQQGITLASISVATKIGVPLLEALERGDVTNWPKGIFRRAFFRDYAAAIGAPVDDLLAEFLHLFPEDGRAGAEPRCTGPLRMTLATTVQSPVRMRVIRGVAGLADAVLVVVVGVIAAWSLGVDRAMSVVVAGLVYYPLTTGWLGRSLALSLLHTDRATVNRGWRTASRGEHPRVTLTVAAEPAREERPAAGLQRDRRTGNDRRRVPRLIHGPEAAPIANVFGLRKGSAA